MSNGALLWRRFLKNGESVVATQRSFRIRFGLKRNDSVPDPNTIRKWISNVRATGSAVPKKTVGRPKNVRTPENIATPALLQDDVCT